MENGGKEQVVEAYVVINKFFPPTCNKKKLNGHEPK